MATYYLDFYAGNDSWAGTGTTTPKLTLNAASNLVTAYTDEIKVRGVDNLYTDIGNWVWTKYSLSVVRSGNYTGSTAAGGFICKTVTGTTNPELYKVASIVYAGGNTTITLAGTAGHCYFGDTSPTGGTSTAKLTSLPTVAAQTLAKQGYYYGTDTNFTGRTFCKITGGWNSGYTTQDSKTLCYNATTNIDFIGGTGRKYWEFNNFIILGYQRHFYNHTYHNRINIVSAWNLASYMNYDSNAYIYYNNYFANGAYNEWTYQWGAYLYISNAKIYNAGIGASGKGISGAQYATFTILDSNIGGIRSDGSCYLFNSNPSGYVGGTFTRCNFYSKYGLVSNFIGPVTNCNFYNYVSGNDIELGKPNQYVIYNKCKFDFNTYGTNNGFTTANDGTFIDCSGVTFRRTAFDPIMGAYCTIYNTTNQPINNLDAILGCANLRGVNISDTVPEGNFGFIYTPTGNTKIYAVGQVRISTNSYTGSTCLELFAGKNHATQVTLPTVDFWVTAANAYTLSFYAKGSKSIAAFNYNFWNNGAWVYSTWKTTAITTNYANYTQAISAGDFKMTGTATLYFRIVSEAKATKAWVDLITLT